MLAWIVNKFGLSIIFFNFFEEYRFWLIAARLAAIIP